MLAFGNSSCLYTFAVVSSVWMLVMIDDGTISHQSDHAQLLNSVNWFRYRIRNWSFWSHSNGNSMFVSVRTVVTLGGAERSVVCIQCEELQSERQFGWIGQCCQFCLCSSGCTPNRFTYRRTILPLRCAWENLKVLLVSLCHSSRNDIAQNFSNIFISNKTCASIIADGGEMTTEHFIITHTSWIPNVNSRTSSANESSCACETR